MKNEDYEPYTQFDSQKVQEMSKIYYEEKTANMDLEEMQQAAQNSDHEMPPLHHTNYNPKKKTIVAVRRNRDGDVLAVKFDDKSAVLIWEAIQMAERDEINNVNTGINRQGHKTLRSNRDEYEENNLSELPEF